MKRFPRLLWAILVFAFIIRAWNLAAPDMAGDDATYAFRSVGYVDFIAAANRQSTPVTWFDEPQWWQSLSFHDAPPLVFALEHASFAFFGDNAVAARVPFVLAGTLSVFAIYLLGEFIGGESLGLAAAAIMTLLNYPVWLSRIGYLDGMLIPSILFSLYFFFKAQKQPRNYWYWGLACGAGLLTKYTFLFLGPVFLGALLIRRRQAFKSRAFLQGCAIAVLLLMPVILYNVGMFRARGHLDAALSTLIGQHPADFAGLVRTGGFNALGVLTQFMSGGAFSPTVLLFAAVGVGILYATQSLEVFTVLIGGFLMALAELSVIGGIEWYGAILVPFVVLFTALGAVTLFRYLKNKIGNIATIAIIVLLAGMELTATIQNQLLAHPLVASPLLPTAFSSPHNGYAELENYIGRFYADHAASSAIITYQEDGKQLADYQKSAILARFGGTVTGPTQDQLVLYDERMNWFASLWTFERRRLYDAEPIQSLWQFLEKTDGAHDFSFYRNFGMKTATIILTAENTQDNTQVDHAADVSAFAQKVESVLTPIAEIRNADGRVAFRVYTLSLQ
ncbi:MAG: glycosyltransferase family 39 protein [Patescibacteria group bacterium]|nr:glycosyltransferase family 39 protein [Patescibacteria group bacterium]